MAYTLTQAEYVRAKTALARARNSGNPDKVLATVRAARLLFDAKGYPDTWSDWPRALRDRRDYDHGPVEEELNEWD